MHYTEFGRWVEEVLPSDLEIAQGNISSGDTYSMLNHRSEEYSTAVKYNRIDTILVPPSSSSQCFRVGNIFRVLTCLHHSTLGNSNEISGGHVWDCAEVNSSSHAPMCPHLCLLHREILKASSDS